MNCILRTSSTFAALIFASALVGSAADLAPGYVDFGGIVPSTEGKFVEVNLSEGILKFASTFACRQEPQSADVLRNLKHVRVNVVELSDANRSQIIERVKTVRQALETSGWTQIVNVREQPKGDDVQIFAKMRGEEAIEGLVVTVIEGNHEVVLVNIVGNIKPEQIAALADRFNIDPLKKVNFAGTKHSGA
jgi:hypothetical protein